MERSVNLEILHGLKPTKSDGDILTKKELKHIFLNYIYISSQILDIGDLFHQIN